MVHGEVIKYIDRIRHQRNGFSDHDGVRFSIKVGKDKIDVGMWILNAEYVEEEEYGQQMKVLFDREKKWVEEDIGEDSLDDRIGERWEEMKDQIKCISI